MTIDIRCSNKKHAIVRDSGFLEVKCDSRFCGAEPGVVVLHVFDVRTGQLVRTDKYKNPTSRKKVN